MTTPLLLQTRAPTNVIGMITSGTLPTRIVLGVLAVASLCSLYLIISRWRRFAKVRHQADAFIERIEKATNLDEAYRMIRAIRSSPYARVFKQGMEFLKDLHVADGFGNGRGGISLVQLEALRLILEKAEGEELDELGNGLHWLAIVGSVSPLLGLMGTVIGITNVFLGIAGAGGSNIMAVAPGVGEALITTVAGLAVAIPAVIAYNYFAAQLALVRAELEGFSSEFVGTLAREENV
ncbi:MAG: MotA/TolQ/ExbB proton channel family protein [Gemmatimonadetes bacterium]|nr:MotA/TolQ/ExbB proton channel family protein [Gemmatimonadota bacterium]